MRVFLDDVRDPPDETWTVVRSSAECLALLKDSFRLVTEISFDHDLGGDDTSRPVALWLEELAFTTGLRLPIAARVHSSNPVGRDWLVTSIAKWSDES